MITVEKYLEYKQPDVRDKLKPDILTEFFEWIEKIMQPERLTAGEAWEKVVEAIKKHSYLYNPEKVREVLPDRALRAAEVVGLNLITRKGGDSFVMNTYLKVY